MTVKTEGVKSREELIGKFYELIALDGSLIARIKINHVRYRHTASREHEDGSISPRYTEALISENGFSWYTVYEGNHDRITD